MSERAADETTELGSMPAREDAMEMSVIDGIAAHVELLEAERDRQTAAAEKATAGMREVALFGAANAQGCLGNYARPLLDEVIRLRAEVENAHLARIEAQNPGIDMDRVLADRMKQARP